MEEEVDKDRRLIEIRFVLNEVKRVLNPQSYSKDEPFVEYREFDALEAFMGTIRWIKGSRGAQLAGLMNDIIAAGAEKEFYPAHLLEFVLTIEQQIPQDIDFSPEPALRKEKE